MLADRAAVLAKQATVAQCKDFGGGRCWSDHVSQPVDLAALQIHAPKQRHGNLGLAILEELVSLLGADDVAGKQNHSGRPDTLHKGSQGGRHLCAVKADDEELPDIAGAPRTTSCLPLGGDLESPVSSVCLCGQICFLSSESKFKASSGVSRFKSTSRSFSSTGCEMGVKIVNCAAGAGRESSFPSCPVSCRSAFSCSFRTSRARSITSFGNPASLATSMP